MTRGVTVNESSKLRARPLYLLVRDALLDRIKKGALKPGGTLPSEIDLYRELGVSLGTLRKALGVLEAENLIVREPGRGTFVNSYREGVSVSRFNPIRAADGGPVLGDVKTGKAKVGLAKDGERAALSLGVDERVTRFYRVRFIGERPFRAFLSRYLPREPGPMKTPDGQSVGEHVGLMYYTIGQRQGLGIGGRRDGGGEPWYVAAKDLPRNRLIVVQGRDHPALQRDKLVAGSPSWISGTAPACHRVYSAKTRYRQDDAPCTIAAVDARRCEVDFAEPQWAVTPGQSVVIYESRVCLGGGIIEE